MSKIGSHIREFPRTDVPKIGSHTREFPRTDVCFVTKQENMDWCLQGVSIDGEEDLIWFTITKPYDAKSETTIRCAETAIYNHIVPDKLLVAVQQRFPQAILRSQTLVDDLHHYFNCDDFKKDWCLEGVSTKIVDGSLIFELKHKTTKLFVEVGSSNIDKFISPCILFDSVSRMCPEHTLKQDSWMQDLHDFLTYKQSSALIYNKQEILCAPFEKLCDLFGWISDKPKYEAKMDVTDVLGDCNLSGLQLRHGFELLKHNKLNELPDNFKLSEIDLFLSFWEKLRVSPSRINVNVLATQAFDNLGLTYPQISQASSHVKSNTARAVLSSMSAKMSTAIDVKKEEWLNNCDQLKGNVRRSTEEMVKSFEKYWKFVIDAEAQEITVASHKNMVALRNLCGVCTPADGKWIVKCIASSLKEISASLWDDACVFDDETETLGFFEDFLKQFGESVAAATNQEVSLLIKWYLLKIEMSVNLTTGKWRLLSFLTSNLVTQFTAEKISWIIHVFVECVEGDDTVNDVVFDFMKDYFSKEITYSSQNKEFMIEWMQWIFCNWENKAAGNQIMAITEQIKTSSQKFGFALMLSDYMQYRHTYMAKKPQSLVDFLNEQLGFKGWNWN